MRSQSLFVTLAIAGGILAGSVGASPAVKSVPSQGKSIPQKTCPVDTKSPIDTTVFADYEGKRVYFCCEGCVASFKKDPKKYLKILADKGESVRIIDSTQSSPKPAKGNESAVSGATKKLVAQKTCPVMAGGAIDKKVYEDYKGQRVYFCCEGCRAPFKKDPDGYLKKMYENGEKPEKL